MDSVFSQPGIGWMFGVIAVIDVLSIAMTIVVCLMFYNARKKQIAFLRTLGHGNSEPDAHELRVFPPLLWIYIVLSSVITIGATALFVFQPHLL